MGKRQKHQSKQEQKEARKKDRQIRMKKRKEAKYDAFKKTLTYIRFFQGFDKELKEMGMQLKDVGGDGSCLFRSIADQIDGSEVMHKMYRDEACRHMLRHVDFYSAFIDEDDDGSLEQYVKEMAKDGEWGGNLELQALSSCCNMNIVIHRKNLDDTIIQPMNQAVDKVGRRFTIHLAYFQQQDFEHYTSVRKLGDASNDPGMILLEKHPNYLGLMYASQMHEKQESEEEMMMRLQMEEMGIHQEDEELPKEEFKIEQPYPGLAKNKKCKCGSKEAYKNCCYKTYEKLKSEILQQQF